MQNYPFTTADILAAANVRPVYTEQETLPKDRYRITDLDGLTWYAKRRAAIAAERETVKAQAAAILARLDSDERD